MDLLVYEPDGRQRVVRREGRTKKSHLVEKKKKRARAERKEAWRYFSGLAESTKKFVAELVEEKGEMGFPPARKVRGPEKKKPWRLRKKKEGRIKLRGNVPAMRKKKGGKISAHEGEIGGRARTLN